MAIVPPPPGPVTAPAAAPADSAKPALDLHDIQGDVVLGLQKNVQCFIFFGIDDVRAFKSNVTDNGVLERITTSETVLARTAELMENKRERRSRILPLVGLNVAFTNTGIEKLAAGVDLGDTSFRNGAIVQSAAIQDPSAAGAPLNWLPPFLAPIDGVLFVTGGAEADVAAERELVLARLGDSVHVLYMETANVRPGLERGHEHFGFSDGISQPALDVANLPAPNPGQDIVDPGLFVFGYGSQASPTVDWMKNGSFMVFRRLRQLVPEFENYLETQAAALGMDPVLLGGRMMGRWKSGAPMELTPVQDDPELGADATANNAFDYADDQAQRRCPFGAHIRKTNPRRDIPRAALDVRRIMRAGIAFGPEVDAAEAAANTSAQDRGLMFVCYQTSIADQFEFVQQSWANNPGFVSAAIPPLVKHRPGDGTAVTVGFDPIIGQQKDHTQPRTTDEPVPNYPTGNTRSTLNEPDAFVVPTGSVYFFVPSLRALRDRLMA